MYYVAAEAAASGFMTMRQMISYPSEVWVTQFRCTDCDWVFHFQQPITADVSFEFQQSYARRWFATHSCLESPRSKYLAHRNNVQPHERNSMTETRFVKC